MSLGNFMGQAGTVSEKPQRHWEAGRRKETEPRDQPRPNAKEETD